MATEMKIDNNNEDEDAEVEVGLDFGDEPRTIKLETRGKVFEVDEKFARISKVFAAALEGEPDAESLDVPPSVSTEMMRLVVKYMEHHKGEEAPALKPPLRTTNLADVCEDKWDAEFMDEVDAMGDDNAPLYNLTMAANCLDIPALLHLCAAKVAAKAKGKTPEEIAEILKVPDSIACEPVEEKSE